MLCKILITHDRIFWNIFFLLSRTEVNKLIKTAIEAEYKIVIPPRKNRLEQRTYDKYIYRVRHLVENAFLNLKLWRGIAARYAKTLASFAAAVQIRCIAIWLSILA